MYEAEVIAPLSAKPVQHPSRRLSDVLCHYSELQTFVEVSLHTSVHIFVYIKEPAPNELPAFSSSGYGLTLGGWGI